VAGFGGGDIEERKGEGGQIRWGGEKI